MLASYPMPPASDGLVTKYQSGIRGVIAERNSLTTVQEFERRERRIHSLLNSGDFFLTSVGSPFRLDRPALLKLKAGLATAIRLTDRLADADGCKEIAEQLDPAVPHPKSNIIMSWRMQHGLHPSTGSPVPESDALRDRMFLAYNKQQAIIAELPTLDLAWLVTLVDGAATGFQRYNMDRYKAGHNRAVANMAFQEIVLRDGSSALWALIRGEKKDNDFIDERVLQCGAEIIWWENGGASERTPSGNKLLPDGLHMTIMQELRKRLVKEVMEERERRQAEKAEQDDDGDNDSEDGDSDWNPDKFVASDVWSRVHELIKEDIGAEQWLGYMSLQWPYDGTTTDGPSTSGR